MPLLIIVAAFAIATSIPIMGWAFAASRSDRLIRKNLRTDTLRRRSGGLVIPNGESVLAPYFEQLAERVRPFTPVGYLDHLERRINLAGKSDRLTVDLLLAFKTTAAIAVVLYGLWRSAFSGPVALLISLLFALLVFILPDFLLDSIGQRRQKTIERLLPDTLDQLTISIEAGLGFDAALTRVVKANEGPLTDEFARLLQDIRIGVPRSEAMSALVQRTDVLDLRLFAAALNQASKYGVPLAHVMRVQSTDLREKRQFKAEERAAKIPVKIVMPLILCILPVLMIVLMGPAIIRISSVNFGG